MFKFEKLEVYQLSLGYCDLIYNLASQLPQVEEYNLKSQMRRAATSIVLNIAEGSTGQTNPEQVRFLSMALRSLYEIVACQHLVQRRGYLQSNELLDQVYRQSEVLARKIQAMRNSLSGENRKKNRLGPSMIDHR